jgi:hypothetical protein
MYFGSLLKLHHFNSTIFNEKHVMDVKKRSTSKQWCEQWLSFSINFSSNQLAQITIDCKPKGTRPNRALLNKSEKARCS